MAHRPPDIVPAVPEDLSGIMAIARACFGAGYLNEETLSPGFLHVARPPGEPGGVAGFVYGLEGAVPVGGGRMAGIVKTVAVDARFRRQEMGEGLLRSMEGRLAAAGLRDIFVPAWDDGGAVALKPLLDRLGYVPVLDAGRCWKGGCDAGKFRCPARKGECMCRMVWFRKGREG
jgi:GNAT superfamily N-acetyltransferase